MNVGAVAYLRRIKDAIKVARAVLDHSSHSLLSGEGATAFATMMGFREESLSTAYSTKLHQDWKKNHCQPNYYLNVLHGDTQCPPYTPVDIEEEMQTAVSDSNINFDNHDTIGMVVVNEQGHVASGASSNGARHKIAGRIGDAPIAGAGSYADSSVGGAAATGDGDVMMRFLPTFQVY